MKFRTDFVTNSSSSSFLLEEGYDEKEFRRHIKRKIKEFREKAARPELREKAWTSEEYDWLAHTLEWCASEIKDLDEIEMEGVDEVLVWYEDEILKKIAAKEEPSGEDLQKLYQWGLLHYAMCSADSQEDFLAKVTREAVLNACSTLMESSQWNMRWVEEERQKILAILREHYPEFQAYGEEAADKGYTYSKLAKGFLGCSKMYYDCDATPSQVVDAMAEFEGCVFCCGHMG